MRQVADHGSTSGPGGTCQGSALLPTLAPFAFRSNHVDFTRADAERLTQDPAAPRPPFTQPAMAVPARLPEKPGDGRLDHSIEPCAHRQDAEAGRLGEH